MNYRLLSYSSHFRLFSQAHLPYMPCTPKIFPILYVTPIAKAPPKTTRIVAFTGLAFPTFALTIPVMTSASKTAVKVIGIRFPPMGSMIAVRGINAPSKNDKAEAKAACHGLDQCLVLHQSEQQLDHALLILLRPKQQFFVKVLFFHK
jgi:hypothetical protein